LLSRAGASGSSDLPWALSSRKATGSAQAFSTPAARPPLSREAMRAALSSPAGVPALLQRSLPGGSAGVVPVEGTATIPDDCSGQQKQNGQSQRYRERVPEPKIRRARGSCPDCEGNHYRAASSGCAKPSMITSELSRQPRVSRIGPDSRRVADLPGGMFEARPATFGQAEISLEELLRVKTLMATVPSRLQAHFARRASQFVSSTSGDSVWRTHREASFGPLF